MKRNIEINDTLQERIDSAIEDVKNELLSYLNENSPDSLPCLSNDLDYSGSIHEIIDGSVPIYTKEIDDTYYLYGREIDEAFENAGIGDRDGNWPMGWVAAGIYFLIEQRVHEWYQDNAEDIFEEWKEGIDGARSDGEEAGEYDALNGCKTPNPFGTDTEKLKHEAWSDGYENSFESTQP